MQTTIDILTKPARQIEYRCPVCGCPQYVSDPANCVMPDEPEIYDHPGIALHCASTAAKFWVFPRRSPQELVARWHWDQSLIIRQ